MAYPLGTPRHITLHWTAGRYEQVFDDYHFCVRGDGVVVATRPLSDRGAHCWMRNTGNIGIAMCAMLNKDYPVTAAQREATAKLAAELCIRFGITPGATIPLIQYREQGEALEETGALIDAPTVTDHCWFAKADGYYPARWDIDDELAPILKKLSWYHQKLDAGLIPFEHIK